jgi:hypothetical protein
MLKTFLEIPNWCNLFSSYSWDRNGHSDDEGTSDKDVMIDDNDTQDDEKELNNQIICSNQIQILYWFKYKWKILSKNASVRCFEKEKCLVFLLLIHKQILQMCS